jgi:tellurite resistance-related uncharacterized protein
MHRVVTGFRQDDLGDWIADLDCLHARHVRHQPPLTSRPWVQDEAARRERIGTGYYCPACDRGELPDDLVLDRIAGPFDADTMPAGLRRTHRVAAGVWGLLRVLEGTLGYSMQTDPAMEREMHPSDTQPIPPVVDHQVQLLGPVRFQVEFLKRR